MKPQKKFVFSLYKFIKIINFVILKKNIDYLEKNFNKYEKKEKK